MVAREYTHEERTCTSCKRIFSTVQGLGMHFTHTNKKGGCAKLVEAERKRAQRASEKAPWFHLLEPDRLTRQQAVEAYKRIAKELQWLQVGASNHISRRDNNWVFEQPYSFRYIAERIRRKYNDVGEYKGGGSHTGKTKVVHAPDPSEPFVGNLTWHDRGRATIVSTGVIEVLPIGDYWSWGFRPNLFGESIGLRLTHAQEACRDEAHARAEAEKFVAEKGLSKAQPPG